MKTRPDPLPADLSVAAAAEMLEEMGRSAWPVGDAKSLYGIVTARDLEQNTSAHALRELVAPDASFPYVHPDHPLSLALERMGAAGVDTVPVVSRANIRESYGVVTLADILTAYGVQRKGNT